MVSRVTDNRPIVIVGAGVAGIAAAIHLRQAGLNVIILEARDRVGGRIWTQHSPGIDAPIELGAEFIHGKPPSIWTLLEKNGKKIIEVDGDNWCAVKTGLSRCDFFSEVHNILGKMDDSSPDESFLSFLERCFPSQNPRQQEARQHAIDYVSGFNAADPSIVGVHWLVQQMRAEEKIEGDRAFRCENGYDDLLDTLRRKVRELGIEIRTKSAVDRIDWQNNHPDAIVWAASGISVTASAVLITVPLGVLKASPGHTGVIEFNPPLPSEKVDALDRLEMGEVIRIVLRFRERFWETIHPSGRQTLADLSFLFSQDEWFPTWWTSMPAKYPLITGWAPFRSGRRLSGQDNSFVTRQAVKTLARLLAVNPRMLEQSLEAAYFHDWQSDPFSRGAYSYGKVGAKDAQRALAAPVEDRLFFAGEATDVSGHNGTVHGAIASGARAADEILKAQHSAIAE